jgi:hypothetical protein
VVAGVFAVADSWPNARGSLLMPTSKHPDRRSRQLANLSRTAATTHGAYARELVDPLAETHRDRLAAQLPNADPELLAIQSRRAAQMELLQGWLATNGLLRRSPKGSIFGAAEFHERLSAQFERTHLAMVAQEREHASGSPHDQLSAIVAELTAAENEEVAS